MLTTPELRRQFEVSLSRIMESLPPELHGKWDGIVSWRDDRSFPDVQSAMIQQLPTAARAAYVTLLNKLSRGKI